MGQLIELIDGTVRITAAMSQPLVQSVDVAGFATLELLLGVQTIEGATREVTVEVITGMTLGAEDGWQVAATFGSVTASDTWLKRTLTGLMRYVRYRVTSVTGTATISLRGVARRWGWRGFVPMDIPACAAWFRADLGVTLSGSTVSAWADQSGNGRDMTQASGGQQPLLVAGAINTHPALRFDGVDDLLATDYHEVHTPVTLFLVYKTLSVGAPVTNDIVWDGWSLGSHTLFTDSTPRTGIYAGTALVVSYVVANGAYAQLTALFNDDTHSTMRVAGAEIVQGDAGSVYYNTGYTLGGGGGGSGRFTNVEVAEAIVYDAALVAADRDRVEDYLAKRYGLE